MEKDDELKGSGNSYDFGARIQDSRLGGRFLSIDPLSNTKPGNSPYLFGDNSPIAKIDKNGETGVYYLTVIKGGEVAKLKIVDHGKTMSFIVEGKAYPNGMITEDRVEDNHDFMYTVVLNFDDPEKSSVSQPIDLGRHNYAAEEWYNFKNWEFGNGGGIAMYTQDGQGVETRIAKGDVNMEEVGSLLGAIDAAKTGADVRKLVTNERNWATIAKLGGEVLDYMMDMHSTYEGQDEAAEQQAGVDILDSCGVCGQKAPAGRMNKEQHMDIRKIEKKREKKDDETK
jgi:hypothetical protein